MNKTIRVAVLGQGRSGFGIHLRWLREAREKFPVVAVADLLPERLEAVAELGAKGYADYRQLLGDKSLKLDLVVNALPSHLHVEGTIAALDAGYHVLCEKPAAVRVKDFDAMEAAAQRNNRRLFIFQNSRFRPTFMKLQEVLASGKLGRLMHARLNYSGFGRRWDWQASQNYLGGNLNNTGPHPLDQAIVLFGEQMPNVFACMACDNPFGDADNFATVTLHGPGSPVIEVVVSSVMAYPQGGVYNLSCTCGGLTGDHRQLKWKYFDPEKAPAHVPAALEWSEKRNYNNEQLPWIEETWTMSDESDGFQVISGGVYNNLYDVLIHNAEPVVKLSQVRRQVAVLEECHRQNPLPKKQG